PHLSWQPDFRKAVRMCRQGTSLSAQAQQANMLSDVLDYLEQDEESENADKTILDNITEGFAALLKDEPLRPKSVSLKEEKAEQSIALSQRLFSFIQKKMPDLKEAQSYQEQWLERLNKAPKPEAKLLSLICKSICRLKSYEQRWKLALDLLRD